ncbi:MAG: GGDEF domain-containing protein [Acidobacteriota bacterium]|nr:GGDEF domain-containing protein [Acidobacteriota bacterium]MDH3530268.1 GGDEF domain-containing protein [Acidobacteriota bacterium]
MSGCTRAQFVLATHLFFMATKRRAKRDLRPALVFLNGDLLAVPIPLEREEVILGRALEADVRINDTKVSRQHARITTVRDESTETTSYVLTDLGSSNGVLLNGERVEKETLHNGDKLTIGKHILRFEMLDEIDREYQHQIWRLLAHDDLTGLLSSRSFFSELRRESARAVQTASTFCVLMMDIDYFKSVNDTYGHLTGSKTIEEIGLCITKTLRTGDAAARFGGEEFAAFLLDAEVPQAIIAAERIRRTIENQPFSVIKQGRASGIHHVTMSIGIASFPHDSTDPIELVEMADSALYRAKRMGRNRTCAYRDLTEEELNAPLPSRVR